MTEEDNRIWTALQKTIMDESQPMQARIDAVKAIDELTGCIQEEYSEEDVLDTVKQINEMFEEAK